MIGTMAFNLTSGTEEQASRHCKKNRIYVDSVNTTRSNIDEKIERLLGHFRKDFEGGISAANLGPSFGAYGSFLPTYQHSPSNFPQQGKAPCPDNVVSKGCSFNPKASPVPERPKVVCNNTKETSATISGGLEDCSMNKKMLWVRLKLGRGSRGLKNTEICSDVGLDKSPSKIIEEMTSFPVPHGALLSPLHDSLLAFEYKKVDQVSDKSACSKKRHLKDRQDDQNSHNTDVHSKNESIERLKKKCKSNVTHDFACARQISVAVNSRSDVAVKSSKTLRDLGNAGNASNLDKTRSSNQTACSTLKEAKKLRDNANYLKSAGFRFESNELFFQSALKYLHGAFLQETLNNASGKHHDVTHMQYYSITAELCKICALEYESRGEMAAAALAYKCMEVAYLRIVYHKQSTVNEDLLKMQSLFGTIMEGESPSSSASGVGGSKIWTAGNCVSFSRVLDHVCFTNSAMEASRKSRNAFAAASSGKHVASVRKVIDFSFQDVGEIVQLVRVATQTITHR